MTFDFYSFRFVFSALDPIVFPSGQPGNILRGAFGNAFRGIVCSPGCPGARQCPTQQSCDYARIFEPARIFKPDSSASGQGARGPSDHAESAADMAQTERGHGE